MKKFPEKWYFPVTNSNREFVNKLRQTPRSSAKSDVDFNSDRCVYGDGTHHISRWVNQLAINRGYELVTEEQLREEYNMPKEFVLPEKWAVKKTEIVCEWLNAHPENNNTTTFSAYDKEYFHFPNLQDGMGFKFGKRVQIRQSIESGYTEINEETFKQYILKQPNMEKKIIGYKLKNDTENIRKAVKAITSSPEFDFASFQNKSSLFSQSVGDLVEAGVLDLWFEPIYKTEFKEGDFIVYKNNTNIYQLKEKLSRGFNDSDGNYRDTEDSGYRYATKEEIEKYTKFKIAGYDVEKEYNRVKVGCQRFDTPTLSAIKDLLSRSELKFQCLVLGESINVATIDKMLKLLE